MNVFCGGMSNYAYQGNVPPPIGFADFGGSPPPTYQDALSAPTQPYQSQPAYGGTGGSYFPAAPSVAPVEGVYIPGYQEPSGYVGNQMNPPNVYSNYSPAGGYSGQQSNVYSNYTPQSSTHGQEYQRTYAGDQGAGKVRFASS